MRPFRWFSAGVGLLVLLLAAVFLSSVVCPPIGERDTPVDPSLREGLADTVPAPLPGAREERVPPSAERQPAGAEVGQASVPVLRVRDGASGSPLAGAEVEIHWSSSAGAPLSLRMRSDAEGRVTLPPLVRGTCSARARLEGWFPSAEIRFESPGGTPEVLLQLAPAGLVRGRVQYTDGRRHPSSGVLHFRRDGADPRAPEQRVDLRADGSFRSPPLEPGGWEIWWTERLYGEADPRLRVSLPLEARQVRELLITVPHPAVALSPAHQPGVQVLR